MTQTADTGMSPSLATTPPPAHGIERVTSAAPPALPHRWLALVFIALAQLMVALDATIVNIALPSAQASLHVTDASRQLVITVYTLAFGGLLLLGGRIADRLGRKRTLLAGLCGFAAASALGGAAPSFELLIAARALQGAFAALLTPTALSLLAVMFTEPRERASAFAVYGSIAGSGAAIGLLLGGALTQFLSWRWCLYVNVPIAVVAATGAWRLLPGGAGSNRGAHFDVAGVLLGTGGLVAVIDACSQAVTLGWSSSQVIALLAGGCGLLAAFVVRERSAHSPLLPLHIVLDRTRGGMYLAVLLSLAGLLGAFLVITYYLQVVLHYTPLQAGLAFLPVTVSSQLGSWLVARRLMPRVSPRALVVPGLLVAAAGVALLTQLQPDGPTYFTTVLPAELLLGAGIACAMVTAFSNATLGVARALSGVASAAVTTAQQIGASLGVAVLNSVAAGATAAYLATHGVDHHRAAALVHGFTIATACAALILVAGAVAAALLINAPAPAGEPRRADRCSRALPRPLGRRMIARMGAAALRSGGRVPARTVVRLLIELVIVGALYWIGARLGLRLAFVNHNVTAVWPPTGIAVAAFFLFGLRVWPGVMAGALLANLTNGAPLDTSIGIAAGNTVAPLLAGVFLRKEGFRAELDRVADVVNIIAAGLLGMLVSATLGTTVLLLTGALAGPYASTWTVWWIGDAMGVIIYAPAILTFVKARNNLPRAPARQVEGLAFLIAMPVAAALLMASFVPLWYIIIPLTLWGALRFRQPIAAITVALVSSVSIVVLVNGYGPFSYTSLEPTTRLVTLQLFNATLALTVMLLTAIADERSRAWAELKSAAEDLEDRVRERSEELVRAQRSIAEANERESASLRVSVQRISHLESIKSDFLRLASHELRGPIGIVRGYVEMLLDGTFGELPPTAAPAMAVLDEKAAHMGRLVDRMLETARLEGEHPPSERRPTDMALLLHQAVDSAASTVTRHTFVVDGDGAPEVVIADPEQIATVLGNLLDNAVRYSPDGGEIRVRLETRDGIVSVAVSDAGIGIAEEDIGRLFKSFSRVVTPDNASIAGTGLGLYISRKLALLNGGDLCVESAPGEGSTFTLTLPLARDTVDGDAAATS